MVKQYGNWMYVNSDPTNDAEVNALLTENMHQSAQAANLDISRGTVEYVFKKVPADLAMVMRVGLDPSKEWWSAAWKVTV